MWSKNFKRTVDIGLAVVSGWTALWLIVGDWGVLGLLNAWAFWLLGSLLPLSLLRLARRPSGRSGLLAGAWWAASSSLLLARYQWLWRPKGVLGVRPKGALGVRPKGALGVPSQRALPAQSGPRAPLSGRTGAGRPQPQALRVLSLNILKENPRADRMLSLVSRELPDIVLVQELEPDMSRVLHTGLVAYDYCHWQCHHRPGGGFGFFSRYPFEITGAWDTPGTRPWAVRATFELPSGQTVDLYNLHLLSIGPGAIRKTGFTGNFRRRATQIKVLTEEIAAHARPALALGDCNFTEGNDAYRQITARLQDAWLVAGRGPGWTWPRQRFPPMVPLLRLDYCFTTPDVQPTAMRVFRSRIGSDHCPILVEARL